MNPHKQAIGQTLLGQTLVEKIAQRFAVGLEEGHVVRSGDFVSIRPAHVMTHDNTGAVIPKFLSMGAEKILDPRQVVFTLDHNVQDRSAANLAKYAKIEAFAREMGVDFYPAGRGIGHQIMCEEGYVWPGTMVVASDSHSNMYGGLGCLGTPVVRTDAAAIWATGRTWWQVPPVARVELSGRLRPGVTGKDVIVALCGTFNQDEVLNHAVEFTGDGIASLSIDDQLTIANMTTEWGALVGLFPVDEVVFAWLKQRIESTRKRDLSGVHPRLDPRRLSALADDLPCADDGAGFAIELSLDLGSVTPHVSGPNHVKVMTPVRKMRDVKVNKAYLVSCVNSRVQDLAQAAEVIRGKKVAEGVSLYIAAASSEVQAESERRGDWQALLDAGATPLPPGCGPCIGLGQGILEDEEVGVSATNRNFKGRMGSRSAEAYLASPAVVAASAVAGHFETPFDGEETAIVFSARKKERAKGPGTAVSIIEGFPAVIEGDLVFCPLDNLNTDGIYPGKYTYIDDFRPEQQAEVAMENYDLDFGKKVKKGDILVGGFNFGTGSSREQAATALKYKGIRLVLAGSFSETYKRNALNNGFMAIETPELVKDLKEAFKDGGLTIPTGRRARIDFSRSVLEVEGKAYSISAVGAAAQELIVSDGLENWVRKNRD